MSFVNLAELLKIVPAIDPADYQAGKDCPSINLGLLHQVLYIINFGAVTGNAVLTVNTGATEGTKTTAETFRYRLGDQVMGTDGADNFGVWATSASLTLTAATYKNKGLEIEVNADELTAAQPWLTVAFDAAASELFMSAVAVCRPRFASAGGAPTVM